MKLLISELALTLLANFVESIGGKLEYSALKIAVVTPAISIVLSQPERYSRLMMCQFRYSSEVGFLYEDVCQAFSVCFGINAVFLSPGLGAKSEIEQNEKYVVAVLEFCKANWAEITRLPPLWYAMAVEISDRKVRPHFPAIADEDLRNKMQLLNDWRTQSAS